MATKGIVLITDDEEDMHKMYKAVFRRASGAYRLLHANSGEEALERLEKEYVDVVLMDMMMTGITGLETLKKLRETDQETDVVMVTAVRDVKIAVSAIQHGAADYLTKPFEVDEILAVVHRVFERRLLRRENAYLRLAMQDVAPFEDIVGESAVMRKVFRMVDLLAAGDAAVLITGESGTGKERIARAIHRRSRRGDGPFVAVNCAAIPESLLESELFGHERGSFTGATDRKPGRFELAAGGVLFLDEIGTMPVAMQSKLLRVIQENEFERVGGTKTIPADVRIVSATNANLLASIPAKQFREDLYYRLNVLPLHLPPLRERSGDVPLLAAHFLKRFNVKLGKSVPAFPEDVLKAFSRYEWPGNVRELENLIERIVTLNQGLNVALQDLPPEVLAGGQEAQNNRGGIRGLCEDFERDIIGRILREVGGNQTQAARRLSLHRTTLISRMHALGLKDSRGSMAER